MAICDSKSLPVAIKISSASPAEVTLVASTLKERITQELPSILVADKAYDSDPLDRELAKKGIALIAPHRQGRVRKATQDGRALRRYRRRWKVERLNAWLQNYRRLVVRYEYKPENFLGFVQLACMRILLKNYF